MKDFFITLFSYIKKHAAIAGAFLIIFLTFAAVFYTYSVPIEPLLYALLLCAVLLTVLGAIRFYAFYYKHRTLCVFKKDFGFITQDLPVPTGIVESDYRELIDILKQSRSDIASAADMKYRDMLDYYTLWAHQIKTPIAAMRLLLQTEEGAQNEELSEQLFKIEQYVEMVLQYLRSDSISADMDLHLFNLDSIVRQAVKKYRKQFLRKKLTIELGELNCTVLTDEKWLVFVIEQIISNALKYTQTGGIKIYMAPALPKTLVIDDTGIGIRPEDLPRVCEKGFTGFNGRADKKSTGIGLFLCKKVLNRLSHTIKIESSIGVGTRVLIGLQSKELEVE